MNRLLILFPFCLWWNAILTQGIRIEGYTKESGEQGFLSQVDLTMSEPLTGHVIYTGTTDIDGHFLIALPHFTALKLSASKPGFKSLDSLIRRNENLAVEHVFLNLEMQRIPGITGKDAITDKKDTTNDPPPAMSETSTNLVIILGSDDAILATEESAHDSLSNLHKARQNDESNGWIDMPDDDLTNVPRSKGTGAISDGFKIVLYFSNFPLKEDDPIFEDNPEIEVYINAEKMCYYMVKGYESEEEARIEMVNSYQKRYPDAFVMGFRAGRRIR